MASILDAVPGLQGASSVSSMIPNDVLSVNPVSFATGFTPQLMLGSFMFSLNTAAIQEMQRSTEHRWASQELFGEHEVLQYLGPGKETITLPGVVYPSYRGGTGQIEKLRQLAASGEPQNLVAATGGILGEWVIESVEEKQSTFAAFGVPRKQEFVIRLRNYDNGDGFDRLVSAIRGLFE